MGTYFYPLYIGVFGSDCLYLSSALFFVWLGLCGRFCITVRVVQMRPRYRELGKIDIYPITLVRPHIWVATTRRPFYDKQCFPQLRSVFHSKRPFIHRYRTDSRPKRAVTAVSCFYIWGQVMKQPYIWGLLCPPK